MTIDFGSDGFDYTRTLCSAIEAYTEKATRHRDVFRYRGMQLRYAIERQLYIQGINSSSLFEAYLEAKGKTPPTLQEQSRRTALESDLACFFGSSNDVSKAKVSKRPSNTYLMAQRAYGWFRSLFRRKLTPLGTQRCSKILIHIGNAKFATYLGPITGKLGKKSYSYLTCENPELAISLEKAGHPVVKCSGAAISLHSVFSSSALSPFVQMMHEADQILTALQTLRPKAVVVVEGNAPKDALTAEACRLLGVPCVCIQQGWSPYVHSGFRNMNYTEMLVWGPHFAELLAPFNPRQQFRVTGSHILQKHPGEESSRSVPSSRTFSFFLQAPCALLGIQAFDAFVELIEQTANRHPSIQFVVREHPGYRLSDQTREKLSLSGNIRFSVPAEERLADLIDQSELAISVFSTVLLEALAVNVVPLICSIGSMTRYSPDLASMNAAIEVHSIVEAEDVIEQAIRSPEIIASIRDHLPATASGFFKKGDAIQEIADVLLAHTVH